MIAATAGILAPRHPTQSAELRRMGRQLPLDPHDRVPDVPWRDRFSSRCLPEAKGLLGRAYAVSRTSEISPSSRAAHVSPSSRPWIRAGGEVASTAVNGSRIS